MRTSSGGPPLPLAGRVSIWPGDNCPDQDLDGYSSNGGPIGSCAPNACGLWDCNDLDPDIRPYAGETPVWDEFGIPRGDGVDTNCNGQDTCGALALPFGGPERLGTVILYPMTVVAFVAAWRVRNRRRRR